jgi:hypothetical protein
MLKLPTAKELAAATESFEQDWGGVDRVLYRLCREAPGHGNRPQVTAKLALIGRAYSAGLERCVTPPRGSQAITILADYVCAHGVQFDAVMRPLETLAEPLTAEALATVVTVHGGLLELLRGVTTAGKTPRSFAAKYLHFHNPLVPIYDEYARIGLVRLVRWDSAQLPFERPGIADPDYYEFCVRFWRLYAACRQAGLEVNVKTLDHYLWSVPT